MPLIVGQGSILLLSLYLSMFWALANFLSHRLASTSSGYALLFCGIFSLCEWCRGHFLTGLPWGLIGQSWSYLEILNMASIIGIYGLSFITISLSIGIFFGKLFLRVFCLLSIVSIFFWGTYHLKLYPTELTHHYLRLVQPSIPQREKWVPSQIYEHMNLYGTLSVKDRPEEILTIIWPEAAIGFSPDLPENQWIWKTIIPRYGHLILGGIRRDKSKVWNSLFAINSEAQVIATYDKRHLVPFGEYMPFKNFVPFQKLTQGTLDYSSGNHHHALELKNLPPFLPLICYEGIFPEIVQLRGNAEWILNLTNDAWYGMTPGPYQHLHIVRTRAIEQGLPLIRSANNGISAIIDPCGRVVVSLPLDHVGVVDGYLPRPIPLTIYGRWGDSIFFGLVFFWILGVLFLERRFFCNR